MSIAPFSGIFEIDSVQFSWHMKPFTGECTPYSDPRSIVVHIMLPESKTRELIVDFSPADYGYKPPKSKKEFGERVALNTRRALAMGWNPESRGKPFRIDAESLPAK